MNNYVCKIATLDEIIKRCDYLIDIHPGNKLWVNVKNNTINGFLNGSKIVYIGILNDEIISEATVYVKEEAFIGDIEHIDNLISNERAYLCGFRTNKEHEGKGYFSKLYKYMENDLKEKGYRELCLGVEPTETKNISIYNKWGFTNFIKSTIEKVDFDKEDCEGVQVDFYYKDLDEVEIDFMEDYYDYRSAKKYILNQVKYESTDELECRIFYTDWYDNDNTLFLYYSVALGLYELEHNSLSSRLEEQMTYWIYQYNIGNVGSEDTLLNEDIKKIDELEKLKFKELDCYENEKNSKKKVKSKNLYYFIIHYFETKTGKVLNAVTYTIQEPIKYLKSFIDYTNLNGYYGSQERNVKDNVETYEALKEYGKDWINHVTFTYIKEEADSLNDAFRIAKNILDNDVSKYSMLPRIQMNDLEEINRLNKFDNFIESNIDSTYIVYKYHVINRWKKTIGLDYYFPNINKGIKMLTALEVLEGNSSDLQSEELIKVVKLYDDYDIEDIKEFLK